MYPGCVTSECLQFSYCTTPELQDENCLNVPEVCVSCLSESYLGFSPFYPVIAKKPRCNITHGRPLRFVAEQARQAAARLQRLKALAQL